MPTLLRPALTLFATLSMLVGLAYPLAVTGIAHAAFPDQAGGSLIQRNGQPIGSRLIGQAFTSPRYIWGRPSATTPMPNNGAGSGGSNLGPLNPAQLDAVRARLAALHEADSDNRATVPVDLVTASASGLDPDISVAGARYQAGRVARARGLREADVLALIEQQRSTRVAGVFGEPHVNVLELNLALDALKP
ncbi:potassium-transporting ATPase subunit KdpC [Massilia sp. TS11]|uniref:potassium-transporting ATPase subunit KdpC n=1 Tax=Massilia sp. TS11 TaxID=2908003 RepID=UPI001EDA8F57|nr:potassium-transporting ATPase subunit KdpC [Massilia sp. TS11]MCG2584361.1 potassium-transporting ATPase subunit KdpC [Massilia sp. TS11]